MVDNRHSHSLTTLKGGSWLARARANFFAWRADDVTSHAVVGWHALLCAIAVLNLALWSLAAIAVMHAPALNHTVPDVYIRMQLWLSGGYVLGCAYRSVLPVYDIPRVVLIDTRLSNVIVGRSVATAAELCFAAQWALMLHHMAFLSHSIAGQTVAALIVPLIVIAEGFSWYAVVTTAQRAHAAENSIWGLAAALVVVGFLIMEPQRIAGLSGPVIVWCVGGAAYVAYIFLFDVPAYWARWRADQTSGRRHLSIAEGVRDVCGRRIVSYRWEVWKNEVLWMSLYFSVGVWSSVSLVYASITLGG